jgi:hypothetical protein
MVISGLFRDIAKIASTISPQQQNDELVRFMENVLSDHLNQMHHHTLLMIYGVAKSFIQRHQLQPEILRAPHGSAMASIVVAAMPT